MVGLIQAMGLSHGSNYVMIKELYIRQCSDYEENGLIPFPGRELKEKILLFENPVDSKIIHCVNIRAGLFLIGFNKLKRINSVELGIYRKNWAFVTGELLRPQPAAKGCIEFVNLNSRINEFDDLQLNIYTDKIYSAVKIEIGDYDRANSSWIALSKYCVAELIDNHLVGFWIDISDY
jgi:hypothetical protein